MARAGLRRSSARAGGGGPSLRSGEAALGIRTGAFDLSKPEGAATAALVESLAAELLERGIRVNGVALSAMSREAEAAKLGAPAAPPEYVADVVLWLLTDETR